MQSQGGFSQLEFQERIRVLAAKQWKNLTERQKTLLKKFWAVITYKWRWQIAMNIPYLAIFILDRTIPAVHKFDMNLLGIITSKFPIPTFISSWLGIA